MNEDLKFRLGGIACLIGAAGFGWWGIWLPYQQALAQAEKVEYSNKIFALVPALIVFGLFFLIGGARWKYRNADTKRFTMIGWVLMAVTLLLALAGWWVFQHAFEALGYHAG